MHYYANHNPHFPKTTNFQNRWSVNVWAGIISSHVIGPYFFEGPLNSERYLEFLANNLLNLMDDVHLLTIQNMWVQHDGAPPHHAG